MSLCISHYIWHVNIDPSGKLKSIKIILINQFISHAYSHLETDNILIFTGILLHLKWLETDQL